MSEEEAVEEDVDGMPAFVRPPFEVLVGRALRLRCPRCGVGKLFLGWFRMHRNCQNCGLLFDRGPGYFLGSTYINYGFTAFTMTVMFLVLRLVFQIRTDTLLWPLFAYCVIVPLLIFRHARAMWLAMDCHFDKSVLEDEIEHPAE